MSLIKFFNFSLNSGENLTIDGGLTLAFALWSRSQAFLALNDGKNALSDLQCSLNNGLPAKHHGEYYVRLARANACKCSVHDLWPFFLSEHWYVRK